MRKLHTDWWVKVVPASPGLCDSLNVSTCGGLLIQILILLQTKFVHLVKQINDRRQLIKVEVVTQSYLCALL